MSHLLAISVGPIQEFIAAARRTRDLWFSSYLLSEISKAVAKSIRDNKGKLIFPHPNTDLDSGDDKINVANVILAELPNGDPKSVAQVAKQAAKDCWCEFAKKAQEKAGRAILDDIWRDQVDDVIEFYAAWVPHTDPQSYQDDRKKVMRLLDGRKNCRDFSAAKGRPGIYKSSLDGQRETVLKDEDQTDWPKDLRLLKGEQLDVVGITKRLGSLRSDPDVKRGYPSVARVAAETWLRGVKKRNPDKLGRLTDACKKLKSKQLHTVCEGNYEYFPFEGTVIYKNRHPDLIQELKLAKDDLQEVVSALDEIGGEPSPYLAVLVADGDETGKTISRLTCACENRALSQTLAEFAAEARNIVQANDGVLVYSGGDDVLAFLPVHRCLQCARKLHDEFSTRLIMTEPVEQNQCPTLSVGIAIGHFMENLEDLLEYGRQAEKSAKCPNRNGLAVHLHKRGGAPIQIRAQWNDDSDDTMKPDKRLEKLAKLMINGTIPMTVPYELRNIAQLYSNWTLENCPMKHDIARLLAKKQSRNIDSVRTALKPFMTDNNASELSGFVNELLIARQIATAWQQAGEQLEPVVEAVA